MPVRCDWCLGATVILETLELGTRGELIPVRCRNCDGDGSVRIERRKGSR